MLPTIVLTALALLAHSTALAAPTTRDRRAVVAHDALSTLPQRVQPGAVGEAIARFNPKLHIASGCQSYAAVNDAGDTGGGLAPSGNAQGGCRDTGKAQTYARIGKAGGSGATGIMYAWYFPKDQLADGVSTGAHRHDWEAVVVWLTADPAAKDAKTVEIAGGAASGHGEFKKTTGALPGGGTAPQVEYFASFPTNHELQFSSTAGVAHAVQDWDAMPRAMRDALERTDFGSANVPFKDGTFQGNLDKAAL